MTFEEWFNAVNRGVSAKIGLDVRDLPDWRFRDAYNDGYDPQEAVEEILQENGVDW